MQGAWAGNLTRHKEASNAGEQSAWWRAANPGAGEIRTTTDRCGDGHHNGEREANPLEPVGRLKGGRGLNPEGAGEKRETPKLEP